MALSAFSPPAKGTPDWDVLLNTYFSKIKTYADETDSLLANKVNGITMTGEVSLYVSTTGNDTTGDGSLSKPYKTMAKAFTKAKEYYGPHAVNVLLLPGTYTENFNVYGFSVAVITLASSDNGNKAIIKGPTTEYSAWSLTLAKRINIKNLIFDGSPGATAGLYLDHAYFEVSGCTFQNMPNGAHPVRFSGGASGNISGCVFNNIAGECVRVSGSTISVTNNTGSGNGAGVRAQGGFIIRSGTKPTATTDKIEVDGGKVFD